MSKEPVRSLFGLFLLGLLSSFGSVVSPVLPQYAEQFGASFMDIGLFFSAYSFTWVFLQLFTGYLSDKYGRRRFVMLGLSIYGLSLILSGLSQNFMQLVIFRVLQGVGLGIFGPAGLGLVAQVKDKGKGFAFYRTANSLGLMAGPIIGGAVGSLNMAYPFFVSGILTLLALPSVFLIYEGEDHEKGGEGFFASLMGMVLTRKIILLCSAAFIAELAFASLDLIIPLFGSSRGLSPASIGIILSSYFIAFTLFQIPLGIVSEKVNKKVLIVFCSFASALPFILLPNFYDVAAMSLALAILGVTLGLVFVQSSALIAEVAPKSKKSLYMAFFDSIIDFSFVIMPPIAAYTYTHASTAPFLLCALLMVIAGTIFAKV